MQESIDFPLIFSVMVSGGCPSLPLGCHGYHWRCTTKSNDMEAILENPATYIYIICISLNALMNEAQTKYKETILIQRDANMWPGILKPIHNISIRHPLITLLLYKFITYLAS